MSVCVCGLLSVCVRVYVREFLSLHKENVNQCKSSGGREGGKGGRGRARVCVREKRRAEERMKRGKREASRQGERKNTKTKTY